MDRGKLDTVKINTIKKWLGTGSINIFGVQLSGKDTQGKFLAKIFDCPLIGGGDILRSSNIPKQAQEALRQGKYIDSEDYLNIVLPYFKMEEFNGHPLILSSVGRWIGEEASVISALKTAQHPIKAVIYLILEESKAFERLDQADRGRDDDNHENLKNRINEFKTKTLPVIDEYRKRCPVIEVDASIAPEAVLEQILGRLYHEAS